MATSSEEKEGGRMRTMSKTSGASRRSRRSRRVRTLRRTCYLLSKLKKGKGSLIVVDFHFLYLWWDGRTESDLFGRGGKTPAGNIIQVTAPPTTTPANLHRSSLANRVVGRAGASPHLHPRISFPNGVRNSRRILSAHRVRILDTIYSTLLVVFRSRPAPSRPVPSRPRPPHPKSIGRLKLQHNPRTLQSW